MAKQILPDDKVILSILNKIDELNKNLRHEITKLVNYCGHDILTEQPITQKQRSVLESLLKSKCISQDEFELCEKLGMNRCRPLIGTFIERKNTPNQLKK